MSNKGSTPVSQTPREEVLDRAAESFPAMLLPRLIGVKHLKNMLSDARRRVNDSHAAQHATLLRTLDLEDMAEDEEMDGGISVAGDTNITIQTPDAPATKPKGGLGKMLLVAALAASGGGALPLVWSALNVTNNAPIVSPADADWGLDLQVKQEP